MELYKIRAVSNSHDFHDRKSLETTAKRIHPIHQ